MAKCRPNVKDISGFRPAHTHTHTHALLPSILEGLPLFSFHLLLGLFRHRGLCLFYLRMKAEKSYNWIKNTKLSVTGRQGQRASVQGALLGLVRAVCLGGT